LTCIELKSSIATAFFDLIAGEPHSVTVNGTIFAATAQHINVNCTKSFLSIKTNSVEHGFNTDRRTQFEALFAKDQVRRFRKCIAFPFQEVHCVSFM